MRNLIPAIFFILLSSVLYCQSEGNILDTITSRFQGFCRNYPREEIFVQTDRDIYVAGEDIWFNICLFDRMKNKLTGDSKIAYLEILNPVNRPVLQKRTGLVNGTGSGMGTLPDTLSPGVYTLRAYTNWMRNFMPYNCFSRRLVILNTYRENKFRVPAVPEKLSLKNNSDNNCIVITKDYLKSGLVTAEIRTTGEFRAGNKGLCYLFVQTHGQINYKTAVNLSGEITLFVIPSALLTPGINQYTVFDSHGKPAFETYSYTPFRESDFVHFNINSPDSCHTRDIISISIEEAGTLSGEDSAYLSITVVPSGTNSVPGIASYMLFGSEYGEMPESISSNGLRNVPDSIPGDLLSAIKSNWIDWNTIMSEEWPEIKYQRETRYHYLYGSIISDAAADTLKNHFVYLSVPGKNATIQYSRIAADKSFVFSLPADNKTRDLIIQQDEQVKGNKAVIMSSFSDKYSELSDNWLKDTSFPPIFDDLGLNYRVTSIYRSFETRRVIEQEKLIGVSGRFYGKPDVEIIMDNYISLPTMQEVFFELIPGVLIRTGKEGTRITVRDPADGRLSENPLLLIDGVVVRDPALIAATDPGLVEKIDVIKTRYHVGDCMFPGIINLITRKGDLSNITLPEDATRIHYSAFRPAGEFNYSDYSLPERKNSHLPDFRNTLYWNTLRFSSQVKKSGLSFPASDFFYDYDIIVQGVTRNGGFVSEKRSMKIIK